MKLTPHQAPLYGRCVVTVQLEEQELAAEDGEGVDYFLLFAGSTQRHLTSTLRSGHDTLQALCPAHDCCESVSVTLCAVCRTPPEDGGGGGGGGLSPLAELRFSFVQDLAFDMAQFLVSTAGRADGLEGALLLDECQIPLQECERLDQSLALALHHLALPPGWSLLGNTADADAEVEPQETLLHFSARRGLLQVTQFLLRQAGAREALKLHNREGITPAGLAALRGHTHLQHLLTRAETEPWPELFPDAAPPPPPPPSSGRLECHLPRLPTHTLTLSVAPGRDPPPLRAGVEQLLLRRLRAEGVSGAEPQSEPPQATDRCCCGAAGIHGDAETPGSAETHLGGTASPQGEHGLGHTEEPECPNPNAGRFPSEEQQQQQQQQQQEEEEEEEEQQHTPLSGLTVCDEESPEEAEAPGAEDGVSTRSQEDWDWITPSVDAAPPAMGQASSWSEEARELPRSQGLTGDPSPSAVTDGSDLAPQIEGLHEGEPPPNTNSLEQKQEAAVGDYAAERPAPGDPAQNGRRSDALPPSGRHPWPPDGRQRAGEESRPPDAELSPHATPSSPDSAAAAHDFSSDDDDDGSFRSVGSSTVDLFHPSEENVPAEERNDSAHAGEDDMEEQGAAAPDGPELEVRPPAGVQTTEEAESGVETAAGDEGESRNAELEVTAPVAADQEGGVSTDSTTIQRDTEASLRRPLSPRRSGSSPSPPRRSSGGGSSDGDTLLGAEPGYEAVFVKSGEPATGSDSTSEVSVSCSSTDDTASAGPSSSSPEGRRWSPQGAAAAPSPAVGGGGAGDAEEEAKDRVSEVPRRSCILRNSIRSLSPLRRHSWGPGKNGGGDAAMNQRSGVRSPGQGKLTFQRRSYSLEGLSGAQDELRVLGTGGPGALGPRGALRHGGDDGGGSLVSLTEEQEHMEEHGRLEDQKCHRYRPLKNSSPQMTLTKSVSMLAISHRDMDVVGRLRRKRRISFSFSLSPILTKSKSQLVYGNSSSSDDEDNTSMRSFSSASGSLAYSISEEEPGPLRSDTEAKGATKVSRTFSYLKNKMYKKTREKERDKKEKEAKEKDKKAVNGHLFSAVGSALAAQSAAGAQCSQCNKAFNHKDAFQCTYCNAFVHKGCRDGLPVCTKVKMKLPKQQFAVPEPSPFPTVTLRSKAGGTRERPWSAILSPEDHSSLVIPSSRRHTSIMGFHGNNLSKSLSISNIAGPVLDEMPMKGLRYLSQSTDSLNRTNQVTESMESLTDEGTEMMDGQLMGEFEGDAKELEADSWSHGVDQQLLLQLDKELVKRQDVIYELMQTEIHHIRTLRIMSEVYSKGLQKEAQMEAQTVERLFPALDDLLEVHTQHLLRLLERKKESQLDGGGLEGGVIINRIGDILLSQFSGLSGESMKRIYGRFCSRHSEAVGFYKDLLTKDKRFKAFIKRKMSSSIVRRLGIPECILLVTQRITKYPVLLQRILQHSRDGDEDFEDLTEALRYVKEVIAAVDARVNEHDKRRRLKDFHGRTDTKSIMMMKSGQIFAREDLLRRRLIHDGALQLKNNQGRLKDIHALLLSDVLVFLQEKDQKYVFAMLDQRSTVISLQKLIVREVANEERGLFLITAGIEKPEMMEVLASSKEERNTWMQLIQEAMQSMEKDEDEGIPSETEDDKRQLETKAREMRDLLRQKDTEIMSLLEEKVRLFRGMWEGLSSGEEACRQAQPFFRSASSLEPPRGSAIMRDALQEVETLQALVNGSLGGAMASVQDAGGGGGGGGSPVCLPRRAETFGGFDSHQMHGSKGGDRDEGEDGGSDLRRTESDGVLKKVGALHGSHGSGHLAVNEQGGNANLLLLLKRNSEQVLHSVSNLHLLLSTLQAVVVQQDSFMEEQRQALGSSSSSSSSWRPPPRPASLIEQEKQRSLEKQRQELASLQRQRAARDDQRRTREQQWERHERQLGQREALLHLQEEEIQKSRRELSEERQELRSRKEEYQKDLERLRDAQRRLDKDRENLQRQLDREEAQRLAERTSSSTASDEGPQAVELDPLEPQRSKPRGRGLNPFSSNNPNLRAADAGQQIPRGLLQLAKTRTRDAKDKKKKKAKGQQADPGNLPEPPPDGEIFFC